MMDLLTEIYESMSRNKLRIALTGFSIAWGIFLLIVLLSAGDGLFNAMQKNFASDSVNRIRVTPGWTTLPYGGLPQYRQVKMNENDRQILMAEFNAEIIDAIPSVSVGALVSHGEFSMNTSLTGQRTDFLTAMNAKLIEGRQLNELDMREARKVVLIDQKTAKDLFHRDDGFIGEMVNVGEIPFQIVGVIKNATQGASYPLYAPITTVNMIYNPEGLYRNITLLTNQLQTVKENEAFDERIVETLADYRMFAKNDRNAVWVNNSYANYLQNVTVTRALESFIWLIGIASLIAGIVGVSNIMLITVRERTREFGIRKAIGATPRSILSLVLFESIGITMLFGYVGMIFGMVLVRVVTIVIYSMYPQAEQVFADPQVDLSVVIAANITMIIAGLIAGYIPAKRAVSIKPVEALAAL